LLCYFPLILDSILTQKEEKNEKERTTDMVGKYLFGSDICCSVNGAGHQADFG
jgi:hypothetical protein